LTTPFRVLAEPLDVASCIAAVSHPSAGGIDVFIGVVRDHNDGQTVTVLEYEAYASMAEKEMERIAAEIHAKIHGVRLSVHHRIGRLEVGDVAVVCAASAPHRDEAFRACRMLIDEVKARVPVWKREHGSSGTAWIGWQDARTGAPR
jgi:molybdopterin synthase catalytic subunit